MNVPYFDLRDWTEFDCKNRLKYLGIMNAGRSYSDAEFEEVQEIFIRMDYLGV